MIFTGLTWSDPKAGISRHIGQSISNQTKDCARSTNFSARSPKTPSTIQDSPFFDSLIISVTPSGDRFLSKPPDSQKIMVEMNDLAAINLCKVIGQPSFPTSTISYYDHSHAYGAQRS